MSGHTAIPNYILDNMAQMGGSVFSVVCYVARKTIGWGKEWDRISISQIEDGTGMTRPTVVKALGSAIADGWIERRSVGNSYQYCVRNGKEILPICKEEEPETVKNLYQSGKEILPKTVKKLNPQKKKETIRNTDPADKPQPEPKPAPADEDITDEPSNLVSAKEEPKETKEPTADQAMFEAICHCVGWDYHIITNGQRGQVAQTKGILAKNGYTIEDLRKFWMYWRNEDWRGKQGQAPTLSQLRAEIGKVKQKQVPSVLVPVAVNGAAVASTFGESQR